MVKIKSFAFILLTSSLWTGKNAGIAITCLHKKVKILLLIGKSKPNVREQKGSSRHMWKFPLCVLHMTNSILTTVLLGEIL